MNFSSKGCCTLHWVLDWLTCITASLQIDVVKDVIRDNMTALVQRGEQLDVLSVKTDKLNDDVGGMECMAWGIPVAKHMLKESAVLLTKPCLLTDDHPLGSATEMAAGVARTAAAG